MLVTKRDLKGQTKLLTVNGLVWTFYQVFFFLRNVLMHIYVKFCESVPEEKCYLNAFEPFPFPHGIISF